MTPDVTLHRKLNEASRRIRLLLVSHWTARALCWTALACVLWLLLSKVNWLPEPEPGSLIGVLLLAGLAGATVGFTRRVTRMDVARLTDGRTAMKERLASAVEFESAASDDPLVLRQIEDANAHAGDLDLRRAYPMRISREMVGALVLALVLFAVFFLPTLPMFWSAEKRQEMADVKRQGAEMEKLIREPSKTAEQQKLDEARKAAKEAQKLAEAMKRGKLNKKAAFIQMARLTKQMEEQQKRMASANAPAQKPMERASQEIKKALEQQQKAIEEASKAKEEAKKNGHGKDATKPGEKSGEKPGEKQDAKNAQNKPPSEAMKQAQQALQKFAQALADQNATMQNQALQELADQMEKGQLSKDEMQTLQQQMQQMAQALKGTNLDKLSQQMKQMAQMMRQIKIDPETLKKLAQMMKQAGGT